MVLSISSHHSVYLKMCGALPAGEACSPEGHDLLPEFHSLPLPVGRALHTEPTASQQSSESCGRGSTERACWVNTQPLQEGEQPERLAQRAGPLLALADFLITLLCVAPEGGGLRAGGWGAGGVGRPGLTDGLICCG